MKGERSRRAGTAGRTVARLAKQVERAIAPLDLSLPQYRVLALLGDGSTAASVLARRLAVSPPSVTALVDGLVARALVERSPDPVDRRRLTLTLTGEGALLLAAADAAADERLGELAALADGDAPALVAALDGWGRALDRGRDERARGQDGTAATVPAR